MKERRPQCKEYYLKQGLSEEESIQKAKKYAKSINVLCKEYYISRGFSEIFAKEQISKIQTKRSKKQIKSGKRDNSKLPQCKEYYLKKGFSEEESIQKAKVYSKERSNKCIEYYLKKGFSEEESIQKIKEIQKKNSLKYKEKKRLNPEKYLDVQTTQLGYWIKKGYSEEDAKKQLSERQNTFSLQICIDKYGLEEGTKVFNKRQEKWQETLNSKPQEEIDRINKSKNIFGLKHIEKE